MGGGDFFQALAQLQDTNKKVSITLQWSGRTVQVQNQPKLRFRSKCFVWHKLINVKHMF